MTTSERPGATIATLRAGAPLSRVQLQFDGHAGQAAAVTDWFADHYSHLTCECDSQPGLTVSLWLPDEPYDGAWGWPARLIQATIALDLAFDLLIECFDQLRLGPAAVVSLHVTDLVEQPDRS